MVVVSQIDERAIPTEGCRTMNPARTKDGDTRARDMDARTRSIFRRVRRRVIRLLKNAMPGIATAGALAIPATAVLAATGVRNIHEVVTLIMDGTGPATAVGMFLVAGTVGALAMRHHKTGRVLDQLQTTHGKDGEEIRRLLRALTGLDEVSKHLVHEVEEKTARIEVLEHKVNMLLEKISRGGLEEDDVKDLWRTGAGTSMTTFQGMFNREVVEIVRQNGHLEFQVTEWAIENLLRRITVGTALREWRIILYVPKVDRRPFADLAMLPARKLLFLIDHLAKVAEREGKEITLAHLRIAVVRAVEPKDEHRSIFVLTRETNDGPEKLVITYHRAPTSRAPDYNGGKVTVHRGAADQRFHEDTLNGYFYGGFQMTLDEFRDAVANGAFPDIAQEVISNSGHFRI
jgi:hypothetical protein